MPRRAIGLFVGLPLAGAILGGLLGEFGFSRGSGIYVAPATACVGLLLAWMLWASRPQREGGEVGDQLPEIPPEPLSPPRPKSNRAGSGATVRVAKSADVETNAEIEKGRTR